jgi:hypothetical protein
MRQAPTIANTEKKATKRGRFVEADPQVPLEVGA